MVKKLQKMAADKPDGKQLAAAIRESAQQIWLAGLGAFSKAQAEGGKVFDAISPVFIRNHVIAIEILRVIEYVDPCPLHGFLLLIHNIAFDCTPRSELDGNWFPSEHFR